MKTQHWIFTSIALSSFFISSVAMAQARQPEAILHRLPAYCPSEDLKVTAENTSNQSQEFWFQVEHPKFKELRVELKPREKAPFEGLEFLNGQNAFSIKTFSTKMKFTAFCSNEEVAFSNDSANWKSFKIVNETHLILHLMNLTADKNPVTVTYKDSFARPLQNESFELPPYFETLKKKVTVPPRTSYIEVKAHGRLITTVGNPQGRYFASTPMGPDLLATDKSLKYFLVSLKNNWQESFVISLQDPDMVRQAREQIAQPDLEKIVVGYIKPGHGNINREMTTKLALPYSWHVDEVTSFADFAHIDCDGSPQLAEERLFERLEDKQGHICFWSYRVVRELTANEVSQGRLQPPKLLGREFLRR